jgi:hypothetical protein
LHDREQLELTQRAQAALAPAPKCRRQLGQAKRSSEQGHVVNARELMIDRVAQHEQPAREGTPTAAAVEVAQHDDRGAQTPLDLTRQDLAVDVLAR